MRRAMDETKRRRNKQIAFNLEHGITPRGVVKRIKDLIDGVYDMDSARLELKAAQNLASYKDDGRKIPYPRPQAHRKGHVYRRQESRIRTCRRAARPAEKAQAGAVLGSRSTTEPEKIS